MAPHPDALTAEDRSTRRIIREYREQRGSDITNAEVMTLNIFGAFYYHAYTQLHLEDIAEALYRTSSEVKLGGALRRLVKAGVLRSYTQQRKQYFEVNY